MKDTVTKIIQVALSIVAKKLNVDVKNINIQVTSTKQKTHGDYACNIALILAKKAKVNPREIAANIIKEINAPDVIEKTEIAGPGFINIFLKNQIQFSIIPQIINQGKKFGDLSIGENKKVNIEYVSSNPTGPLHVGHGRGAAIGSAIASILKKAGFDVTREYYVNDAGRQMDILAVSIWLRYLEQCGCKITFPVNAYKGDYIHTIASDLMKQFSEELTFPIKKIFSNLPEDYNQKTDTGNKEIYIDTLIARSKNLLGNRYSIIHKFGLEEILKTIKLDLKNFNVEFDCWFSEKSLMTSSAVDKAITTLEKNGHLYNKNNAVWFKATQFNDEKDRCLIRENGQSTYFASDAAYLKNKFDRGFDKIIYLFGADHHGYIARLLALGKSFGYDTNKINIPLVQFAVLYRNGKQVQMSTRSGSFVTLRTLREETGTDAARFFYIMRKADQHLDFDLDLATSKSNENPVYYIQYAHARICSIFKQAETKNIYFDNSVALDNLNLLDKEIESSIANKLAQYPVMIGNSAQKLEPHLITNYLKELANLLHSYYNSERFILEENNLMQARFALLLSIKSTITNALTVLGISSPETM
jgi:arginyl-tRNA synthetase